MKHLEHILTQHVRAPASGGWHESNKWWTCWQAFSHFQGFTWKVLHMPYMSYMCEKCHYTERSRAVGVKMKWGRRWNRIENEVEDAGVCDFSSLIKRCSSFTLSFSAAPLSHDSLELSAAPSAGCSWEAAPTLYSHIICSVSVKAANHSSKHPRPKCFMHYVCLSDALLQSELILWEKQTKREDWKNTDDVLGTWGCWLLLQYKPALTFWMFTCMHIQSHSIVSMF